VPVGSGSRCNTGGRAFFMSLTHVRLGCPLCGMLLAPARLESDFPLRLSTFTYESNGRGRGGYVWNHNPDLPDHDQLLAALRDKLARCLDALDLEIGLCPDPLFPSSSVGVRVTRAVPIFPFRLCQPSLARHALISPIRA